MNNCIEVQFVVSHLHSILQLFFILPCYGNMGFRDTWWQSTETQSHLAVKLSDYPLALLCQQPSGLSLSLSVAPSPSVSVSFFSLHPRQAVWLAIIHKGRSMSEAWLQTGLWRPWLSHPCMLSSPESDSQKSFIPPAVPTHTLLRKRNSHKIKASFNKCGWQSVLWF